MSLDIYEWSGVDDGIWTHDNQIHNLGLYHWATPTTQIRYQCNFRIDCYSWQLGRVKIDSLLEILARWKTET